MHSCPTCDSQCYCDGEDTFIELGAYGSEDDFECQHECEVEDFDEDADFHDCPRCTEPCECLGGTWNCTHACPDMVPSRDRQSVSEALVAPLFDMEKK